ncbi:MAG: tryptophan--tRNA ligase [Parcubacteria group bacterium]|nr:tryptophan--tRNA ligase [Parcubacteria group bacterium]MCR4342292.1 tryptophan--tRNA ligase [Patescibacteria group bacterium]
MTTQKTIFSGIQPSGNLHIGNYLGAIKQWIKLQDSEEYNNIFCIVDEHAITVPQDPEILKKKIMEVTLIYLAAGIDPKKSLVFIQSRIPEHAELAWILNTITPLGELQRMTQFKDKAKEKGLLAGLLNYPVLMAGDILLYGTDIVPVGEDQVQHVEFTRMIAKKFNNQYGETFKIPKPSLVKEGKRIMGLDDPKKKMSKSAPSPKNYIAILDEPDTIRKKISSAVTDSGNEVKYDEKNKPAVSNLLNIYSLFSNKNIKDIEKEYKGKDYSTFKKDLAEVIITNLSPIQEKYKELYNNPSYVENILKDGETKAKEIASKKLTEVKQKIGFI